MDVMRGGAEKDIMRRGTGREGGDARKARRQATEYGNKFGIVAAGRANMVLG